ncbi:hypothetical protein B0H16DRAFT_34598 [Mycena metata]|uniref:Uncharacterized protein n=1 Tax=Mycena metata TaxID=1033252 RepID=A0AAD7KJN8_9AGAR|nr:hypothetical protein B0H16DRAFT_34598 [Mycena metata]
MITPSSSVSRPQAVLAPEPSSFVQSCDTQEITPNQFEPTVLLASSSSRRPQSRDVYRQHDLNLSHQLPPSSPIRSPIPTPSPSPRRARKLLPPKKSTRPLKRQASDAYAYLRSDPDDEWSTLPARKKVKASEQAQVKLSGVRTTAAFRLPGTVTKGRVTGLSATSERRVVTFLPPPLKAGKAKAVAESAGPRSEEGLHGKAPSRAPKHSRDSSPPVGTPKRRRISDNPYPSPANSCLTPGEATVVAQSDAASSNIQSSSPIRPVQYRFPSPPTSDPMPTHDPEVHTTVAVNAVSERYPRTKSVMRQRKHETEVVWDLLELPSCGNVHSGATVDGTQSLGELPVVVWEGRS